MKSAPVSRSMLLGGFCGFIAAGIVGWSLGGGSVSPAPSSARPLAQARKNERPARPSRLSAAASAAGARLAPVRGAATPEARMRATIDLANSLPVSEFGTWMEGGYFNLRGGAELTLFTKILMERWMKEDPEGLVEWSLKNDTYQSHELLSKWSEKEPQRAIAFFKSHPHAEQEMSMLQSLAKSHPDLALRRFLEITATGVSSGNSSRAYRFMQALAESSPAALEASLASLPPVLRSQAETALSGRRLVSSFATEIRALWELPNGWKIFEENAGQNSKMAAGVFDELANLPPAWRSSLTSNSYYFIDESTAEKWLNADLTSYGFTPEQEKSLKRNALGQMDRGKPEEIFKRMAEMDLDDDGRRNLISNVFAFQSQNPEKAEALVALLGSEADRDLARSIIKDRTIDQDESTPDKPEEWLERLGDLDPKNSNPYSLMSAIQNWDPVKLSELKSKFNGMPDDKKQTVAQIITNNDSVSTRGSEIHGMALHYLVSHPVELPEDQRNSGKDIIAASSGYVVHLALDNPDAATEWIRTLPAGDAKSWAEKNLATNWAQYDPKAVEQWLKTLPVSSREEVKKHMNQK